MRKSRFTESQIVAILKQGEAGVPIAEILRQHNISKATYFHWRAKYAGASVDELKRLKELEAENAKLKRMYCRTRSGERGDQGRLEPKAMTPSAKREALAVLVQEHGVPVRRACQVVRLSRAAYYQPPRSRLGRDSDVVTALNDVVGRHSRWGFWKCFHRLRRAGHRWNHKRVHRIYCTLRLNLPRRTKRRVPARLRQPLVAPARLNEIWALDFMADALYDGRNFRTFNVLDEGNREALAIEIGPSIPSARVIRILDDCVRLYGRPARVRVDNGPELTAETFVEWCTAQRIAIGYIQPGKPDQNAFIERFNRTFRQEVLDAYLLTPSSRCRTSPRPGSRPIIPSGPMTASARCRPWRFCRG